MPSLLQPVDHSGHTVDSVLAAFAIPLMLELIKKERLCWHLHQDRHKCQHVLMYVTGM